MMNRSCLLVLVWLPAAPTLAQQPVPDPDSTAERAAEPGRDDAPVEVQLRALGAYYVNFTQVPSGQPRENVLAGTADARVAVPLRSDAAVVAYGRGQATVYEGFDPSFGLAAGLTGQSNPHRFGAEVGYLWRTPRFETIDDVGFADVLHLGATYGIRATPDVEVSALGDIWRETYSTVEEKNNAAFDVGGAVRYRGFGRLFSPEVGAAFGRRNVTDNEEDYGQRTFWATVRSAPSPPVYVQLRYRLRMRGYAIDDPAAVNFEREDTRHQLTLSSDVRVTRNVSWVGYYAAERANSTRESRRFTTHFITTGVVLRL